MAERLVGDLPDPPEVTEEETRRMQAEGREWHELLSSKAREMEAVFHVESLVRPLGAASHDGLDSDLARMTPVELVAEVKKLREGIRRHRDASNHDLCWYVPELWGLLPERVEPQPEVPPREEFLARCACYRDSLAPPLPEKF